MVRGRKRNFSRFWVGVLVAGWGVMGMARGEVIAFHDGTVLREARVIVRGEDFISVQTPSGVVRFPLTVVKAIDGESVVPAEDTAAAAVPEAADQPLEVAADEPKADAAAPAEWIVEAELPGDRDPEEATAEPVGGGLVDAAAEVDSEPAGTETVARWNVDLALLILLVGATIWMRSLMAVQRDLHRRHEDLRVWSLVALLLPGVGAGIYFGYRGVETGLAGIRAKLTEQKQRRARAKAVALGKAGAGDGVIDPAEHLAKRGSPRRGREFLDTERQSVAVKTNGAQVSGLDHAGEILQEAILESASDIHIEPAANGYRVRYRLDGILHERSTFEPDDGRRLVGSLKTLAGIDIAEKRRAQDGKFRQRISGREVDFRVATANSIYGEKMVIRVLDHESGVFDLTSLGMPDDMLANFRAEVHARNGMILATGPTGSGKTSTLYAALRELDATRLNIMTIEDPAEYELPGATQIAVNPKAGITYESGLRSILRQDPDVILVGEMRDAEAAEVALRAALTGHLLLSSLHTKDAIGTVARLQDMGIERYQVASALLMVVAQRLVRVLCPECRREYPAEGNELESIGFSFDPGTPLYAPTGCPQCHGTGFKGRTGLFELLVLNDDFRRVIGEGADEATLMALAVERGFKSYRHDGAEKILMGITTVDEVLEAS